MAGFGDPSFYRDRWAAVYDDHFASMDPESAVEFLSGLAGQGRVLELAIGTGRVALPLAARRSRLLPAASVTSPCMSDPDQLS